MFVTFKTEDLLLSSTLFVDYGIDVLTKSFSSVLTSCIL